MNKRTRNLFLVLVTGLLGLLLVACGPVATPAPTSEGPTPKCSARIGSNGVNTMSGALAALGKSYANDDPKILVNGVLTTKSYNIQPKDFVVLATKPTKCSGGEDWTGALKVDFGVNPGEPMADPNSKVAWWRNLDGFKASITPDRVTTAATELCGDVRWGIDKAGFNNDLATGGCDGYTTFLKYSVPQGPAICQRFDTVNAAYNAAVAIPNLDKVGWLVLFTVGNTDKNYCQQ